MLNVPSYIISVSFKPENRRNASILFSGTVQFVIFKTVCRAESKSENTFSLFKPLKLKSNKIKRTNALYARLFLAIRLATGHHGCSLSIKHKPIQCFSYLYRVGEFQQHIWGGTPFDSYFLMIMSYKHYRLNWIMVIYKAKS